MEPEQDDQHVGTAAVGWAGLLPDPLAFVCTVPSLAVVILCRPAGRTGTRAVMFVRVISSVVAGRSRCGGGGVVGVRGDVWCCRGVGSGVSGRASPWSPIRRAVGSRRSQIVGAGRSPRFSCQDACVAIFRISFHITLGPS